MKFKRLGNTDLEVAAVGMGTWGIGGFSGGITSADRHQAEALRHGIELGMTHIDTAESYGAGHSEEVVGEAVRGVRDRVFIATKVSPEHFHYDDVIKAADRSLRRLEVSYIDLYQLHWPSPRIPIEETMRAMEHLLQNGKIRFIGVSNFSVNQLREAQEALSQAEIVSNQVEYSLMNREVERELLPYCQKEKITIIAYSPLARGELLSGRSKQILHEVSTKYGRTPAQVAINWLISKSNVVAIPKAATIEHLEENAGASRWGISNDDANLLDRSFPP